MNNLKRILSLALASVMLVGMMVVGASAAEFTDADDIANKDAVDTLVALNVIKGMDPEHFVPEGNVTRAQMAKMIAVALNGGNEDFRGSSTGSQFVDVKDGQWYVKFINYCASKNIINGRNATTFDPEGMVTATETAVMVMRAMGYRNETFLNDKGVYSPAAVDAMAESLGLYTDTTDLNDTSLALTRQNAAQVIYNAVQLPTPEYTMTYNSQGVMTWTLKLDSKSELTGKTMLEKHYKAKVQFAILDGSEYSAKTGKFTYSFKTTGIQNAALTDTALAATTLDVSALHMQKVRVVYAGKDILGISAVGNNVLGTGVWGSLDHKNATAGKPATIDGYEYDAEVSKDDAYKLSTDTKITPADYDTYTLIDNDGDNKIDAIVVNPVALQVVTNVADGVVTTDAVVTGEAGGEYTIAAEKAADVNAKAYEGIAKDDYVLVTNKDNKLTTILTKVDVTENVQATAATTDSVYTIGGQKYTLNTGVTVTLGTAYDLVAVNGYVLSAVKHTDGTTSNALDLSKVAYVTGVGAVEELKNTLGNSYSPKKYSQKVELLFTDGTKSIVDVVNFGVKGGTGDDKNDPKPITATEGNTAGNNLTNSNKGLIAFTAKDGKYSLTSFTDPTGYDKTAATTEIKNGKQGAVRFNDSAVLFVAYTNADGATVAVLSGATVNGWETTTGTLSSSILYAKGNANGFKYVDLGVINLGGNNLPGAAATDFMYGYVTANAVNAWNADAEKTQPQVTVWNGEENVTYFVGADGVDASTLVKKTLVKYQLTGGVMTSVTVLNKNTLADTVDATDGSKVVVFGANEYELTTDTVVLYIKESDGTGRTTGTIKRAKEGVNNVYAIFENNKLTVLFVDVDNKVAVQPE